MCSSSIYFIVHAIKVGSTIGCAIDSIVNQTVSVSGITVVDDGSDSEKRLNVIGQDSHVFMFGVLLRASLMPVRKQEVVG